MTRERIEMSEFETKVSIEHQLKDALRQWQECSQEERKKVTQLLTRHRSLAEQRFIKANAEPSEEFDAFDSARRILWASAARGGGGSVIPVDDFIRGGGSACPFARGSSRLYVTTGIIPAGRRAKTLEVSRRFVPGQSQALLVVGPKFPNFVTTRYWAQEVFLELMTCFELLDGATEKDAAAHVKGVGLVLRDDSDPRRPILGFRGEPLFAICMAPCYPRAHPRYAPVPVVVVTWARDVAEVHGGAATGQIRQIMKCEHGFEYDADDLMLPLPART